MTSEGTRTREKIYIIGHKNPDTDSICSAIAYTELKKAVLARKLADGTFEAENPLQEGMPVPIPEYIACRAGIVNEETKYVLEYFDVEPPQYQDNVQPQIADMDLNLVPGIEGRASIKQAWELMQEEHAKSVPVLAEGKLKGIVTITDIAQSYICLLYTSLTDKKDRKLYDNKALAGEKWIQTSSSEVFYLRQNDKCSGSKL